MQTHKPLFRRILQFIYPPVCLQCDSPGVHDLDLCTSCYEQLVWNSSCCQRCALPLPSGNSPVCGACSNRTVYFDYAHVPFIYKNFIQEAIPKFKFNQKLNYGKLLAELFCTYIHNQKIDLPDVIIPVPLFSKKIKSRGYNQSLELAKIIGKHFEIEVYKNSVKRKRNTKSQMTLPAKKRADNVKNAFELNEKFDFTNKHVVILDDVMTTGNTVNEVAKVVRKAGANKIGVWCIARVK